MTIYTHPALVLKKYEGGKGEEEKKYTHTPIVGGARTAHWAYWWKRDECWSEVAQRRGREEGESPPTITLPSSDSFERSQSAPEHIFSIHAPVLQHLTPVEAFFLSLKKYIFMPNDFFSPLT